mgnify:CR=1 FL=1
MLNEHFDDLSDYRIHLVTHYSLWQDAGDKHEAMEELSRLENELLVPYSFYSVVHGHNHRYTYQNTTCPSTHYRILRIGNPTLSDRTRFFERGILVWDPDTSNEPELVVISDEESDSEVSSSALIPHEHWIAPPSDESSEETK